VRPDRVDLAPNVAGWNALALESMVREGLGIKDVVVGSDFKAACLAESRWGTLAGSATAMFLSLGTGVAAAVIADGKVLSGAHGAAGEIAYCRLRVDDTGDLGDGRAPLEEIAGGRFIGLRASELAGRAMTAEDAFTATDPATRRLVDDSLDELAVHVANMALLVDPDRIAVGGGLMGSSGRILAALSRRLDRTVPFPPSIVPARFLHDAPLMGAVGIVVDAVMPKHEQLLELEPEASEP
jgi:glucokinase